MNTRRTPGRKEEGGLFNERVPHLGEKVHITNQEDVNEAVAHKVPQVTQIPQVPQGPEASDVEGDMSNEDIRASL